MYFSFIVLKLEFPLLETLVSSAWNYSFIAWKPTRLSYSLIYHSKEQYMIVAGYDSKA